MTASRLPFALAVIGVMLLWPRPVPIVAEDQEQQTGDVRQGTPVRPQDVGRLVPPPVRPQTYQFALDFDARSREVGVTIIASDRRPIGVVPRMLGDTLSVALGRTVSSAGSARIRIPADSFWICFYQTDSSQLYISLADTAKYLAHLAGDSLWLNEVRRCGFISVDKSRFRRIARKRYLCVLGSAGAGPRR